MIETLRGQTRRFRLRQPETTNLQIAKLIGGSAGRGAYMALPESCFYIDGSLAAIRVNEEEVAIFQLFEGACALISDIANEISEKPAGVSPESPGGPSNRGLSHH